MKNNLEVIEDINKSIQKEEEGATKYLSSHFSKSGKILAEEEETDDSEDDGTDEDDINSDTVYKQCR